MEGCLKAVFVAAVLMFGTISGLGGQTQSPKTDCPSDSPTTSTDCSRSKIEPHKEVIAVTGTFTPTPVENIDRSLDVIDIRADSLLYDHWVDYLHADPSIDLRQRGTNDIQGDLSI